MKLGIRWIVALLAASATAVGGLAWADRSHRDNDALADLAKARVSLVQAIVTAEGEAGGKAIRAEFESELGAVIFDVEVVKADGKVFDVKVDAVQGNVLSSEEDDADRDECEDDDD